MSVHNLNLFCSNLGIEANLPMSAKVNAVCHCFGLSTTGGASTSSITPRASDSMTEAQRND